MQDMVGMGDLASFEPGNYRPGLEPGPILRGGWDDARWQTLSPDSPKPSLQTRLSYTFIIADQPLSCTNNAHEDYLGPPKRVANIAKHGLDFAALTEDFFADALVISAKSGRYLAIGKDVNGVISVVFVTLGLEGISVISMRPASRKERRLYNAQS
jgi:uncharacterized DUF497 family protein